MKKLLSRENKRDLVAYLKLSGPLIFILGVGVHFWDFIIGTVEEHLAINLAIFIAATYGVILIYMRMRHAQVDFRVIERFGKEARAGRPMRELLEEPWLKGVYVRHYLSHIANTGGTLNSQMDQNAIESELHALQAEYNSRLELPQFLVGFMIALGLLGTFIGLLQTLTGISGMLNQMGGPGADVSAQFAKLVVELRKPLAGMGVAFSASMFGLIGSLMLALMMTNLRRYISRVVSLARNVMHDLIVINSVSAPAQQSKGGKGVNISSISNTTLAGKFELLAQKMEAVLGLLEQSIGSTQRMIDMMGFGPRMRELSEKTLEEIKGLSSKTLDQQRLVQNLIDINVERVRSGRDMLEIQQQNKDLSEELLQAIKSLAASDIFFSQRRDQEFRDRLLSEIKALNTIHSDQKKLAQTLIDLNDNGFKGLSIIAQGQRDARDQVASLIGQIIEGLQKVEEVNIGEARHMYDIKDKLTKFGNNLTILDVIASGIGGHTALLETLVEEARLSNFDNPNRPPDENQESEEDIY